MLFDAVLCPGLFNTFCTAPVIKRGMQIAGRVAQVYCSPDLGPAGWLFRPRRRAREPANPLLAPGSGQSSRAESCLPKGFAWHAARSRLHSSRVSFSSERAPPLAISGERPSEAVVGVT